MSRYPSSQGRAALVFIPLAVLLVCSPAVAGGMGCETGRSDECYEKVATPDIYRTVSRPVVVAPGRTEVLREPAVTATRTERVETAPGGWIAQRVPAQYAAVARSVQIRAASVSYVDVPAQYRWVRESVVVRSAAWRWERQVDRRGHETMCKIMVPAVMREVERQVQVAPATRIRYVVPAESRVIRQVVQINPPGLRRSYVAPSYTTFARTFVVQPARDQIVRHPPVVAMSEERVLVRRGGTRWRRTSADWLH